MASTKGNQALVFGASGISGWAIAREAISYPTSNTFERVVGLTNRPFPRETSLFPQTARLQVFSGVDLTKGVDAVEQALKGIEGIQGITHVYFSAYVAHDANFPELVRANGEILKTAVLAVEKTCPNLQFWTLQTGGKGYGVEYSDKLELKAPFVETLPRIPEPYASNIFYYVQQDLMKELSAGKPWNYCELRPDAIIGFVPNNNFMNLAQALGLFLSLWRSLKGPEPSVPFPGSEKAYRALHTDTSQDILAKAHIHTSLHPDQTQGKAFNVADGPVTSWEKVWPGVCAFFGLRGAPPAEGGLTGEKWVHSVKGEWAAWEKNNGLRGGMLESTGWGFMTALMNMDFDRQYDLNALKSVGFKEETDTVAGYHTAFSRMKQAKFIP
ncbi:MAG: DNA polymerase zeta [Chaenotheca gracillima]|nr:MAG: DNA polymerase zeta [Chaenotheca gracillima]